MKLLSTQKPVATPPVSSLRTDNPVEAARLTAQAIDILKRLQAGPASNTELAAIAKQYNGRIADCRDAGYQIECFKQDHTGEAWYRLLSPDPVLKNFMLAVRVSAGGQHMLVKLRVNAATAELAERRARFRAVKIEVLKIVEEP